MTTHLKEKYVDIREKILSHLRCCSPLDGIAAMPSCSFVTDCRLSFLPTVSFPAALVSHIFLLLIFNGRELDTFVIRTV